MDRAEREARAAARLNHPGVVGLYELDHDEHSTYLVSELVRGRTFAELARAGALSDSDVARIGIALCDALDHAHERGVIHRDVKPQNVMVLAEPDAGAGFAKLADFGVAHLASGDVLTRTGDVVGTLAYMAPEQAEGLRVTPAADVYALALMLYEAWTGVNPVRGHGPASTARRLGRRLPRLADRRRDLPYELCDAIDACLDPNPLSADPPIADLRKALAAAEPAPVRRGRAGRAGHARPLRPDERERPDARAAAGADPQHGARAPGGRGRRRCVDGGRARDARTGAARVESRRLPWPPPSRRRSFRASAGWSPPRV